MLGVHRALLELVVMQYTMLDRFAPQNAMLDKKAKSLLFDKKTVLPSMPTVEGCWKNMCFVSREYVCVICVR